MQRWRPTEAARVPPNAELIRDADMLYRIMGIVSLQGGKSSAGGGFGEPHRMS